MEDISPSLLIAIKKSFSDGVGKNKQLQSLFLKVRDKTANYEEAHKFSKLLGQELANAFDKNLSSSVLPDGKMYFNIAEATIKPMLQDSYSTISEVAQIAQTNANKKAKIGLKAIKPELNEDRIDGIINRIASEDVFDDIKWITQAPVKEFAMSVVDDSIKENSEFLSKTGLRTIVTRTLSGGKKCDFCERLAGTYMMPDVPSEVFARHDNCYCTIDVKSEKTYRMRPVGNAFSRF